jgi:hypothetical protein
MAQLFRGLSQVEGCIVQELGAARREGITFRDGRFAAG